MRRKKETILKLKVKAIREISIYIWNNRQDPALWEGFRKQIRRVIAVNLKRLVIDGLIPPLCVAVKYIKIGAVSVLVVAVIMYSIRSVLQPMLIRIHDELRKIGDFLDKVAC